MKSAPKNPAKQVEDLKKKLDAYNLGNPFAVFFFLFGIASILFFLYLAWVSFISLEGRLSKDLNASSYEESKNYMYKLHGFKTDISKTSINIDKLYKEGPARDSIPPINSPKFSGISADSIKSDLKNEDQGILVKFTDKKQRFYPLKILNWHEVVNDVFETYPLLITYSPITGTAMVFERRMDDGKVLEFGATGMLYESNLIMFDTETESLWSQNEYRSVAGDFNNTNLKLIAAHVVTAGYVRNNYPEAETMTENTGFVRDYSFNPYENYQMSSVVYPEFGISQVDAKYPPKEILYSVPFDGKVFSVFLRDLDKNLIAKFDEQKFTLIIEKSGEEINASAIAKSESTPVEFRTAELPGYYEMWFSWAVKHANDGTIYQNGEIIGPASVTGTP